MDSRRLVPKRSTFGAKRTKKYDKSTRDPKITKKIKNKIRWTHAGWCRNAQRLVPRAQKAVLDTRCSVQNVCQKRPVVCKKRPIMCQKSPAVCV